MMQVMRWISENIGSILVGLGLAALVLLAIRSLIKRKKEGKSSCGCSCDNCAMKGRCNTKHK